MATAEWGRAAQPTHTHRGQSRFAVASSALRVDAAAVVAAPAILRGVGFTKEPVRLDHIGLGTRERDLIRSTGAVPEAKVVALCDGYAPHLKRGLQSGG